MCRRLRRRLHRDERGLSLLAYSLGAALIVAPLVVAMAFIGPEAASGAEAAIDGAFDSVCGIPGEPACPSP